MSDDERCCHEEWWEYRTSLETGWVRVSCTACDQSWTERIPEPKGEPA